MSILVGRDTRLVVAGITGREGEFHARQMQEYGTRVVAGVTPGKGGQRALDGTVPVFDTVAEAVRETGANLGVCFDGDGDRLIAIDEKGNRLTGDQILVICALMLKEQGRLKNDLLVTTVMSNIGLERAIRDAGGELVRTAVGDRYVVEKMVEGRIHKYLAEITLVGQPFVKDPQKTVGQLVQERIGLIKENIVVRRFARFKIGEAKAEGRVVCSFCTKRAAWMS